MFDMKNPFSSLHSSTTNGATHMIMQRQANCDMVINRLVNLYYEGYNIYDEDIFKATCTRYGLKDITLTEKEYILENLKTTLR